MAATTIPAMFLFGWIQILYYFLKFTKGDEYASEVTSKLYDKAGDAFAAIMLMYGKEASNRKQEIDRQHYTIPNQRPKDKHCGKI